MIAVEKVKMALTIFFIIISVPILKAMLGAPFVPTPKKTMQKMFKQAKVKPGQVVYDLGCGDGRFIRTAAREHQAKAIGIELNPFLYLYTKIRSWNKKDETILCNDFSKVNLSDADVVICYLLPKTMAKIENKLDSELKKGAKIISHGFKFKTWKPIDMLMPEEKEYGRIYIYEKN